MLVTESFPIVTSQVLLPITKHLSLLSLEETKTTIRALLSALQVTVLPMLRQFNVPRLLREPSLGLDLASSPWDVQTRGQSFHK